MIYREYAKTGLQISAIGLGGHEFHLDGKIKGFSDDHKLAVTAGHIFEGFGANNREEIVKTALDLGINLFDLTIDSEKEAMGRILTKLRPSQEIIIQTRPEGMVYGYDPANRKMADYSLLKQEAVRILRLIGRETVDILNFGFMKDALHTDGQFLDKIGDNIRRLKQEGLIRFASADTFSGNEIYLRQIQSGHFDSIFINYNMTERHLDEQVIPQACGRSMSVLVREAFIKGKLFDIGVQAGIHDRSLLAAVSMKYVLTNPNITAVIVGVSDANQLKGNVKVLDQPSLNSVEQRVLEDVMNTELFQTLSGSKRKDFFRE